MSERKIYQPCGKAELRRRFEWVSLPGGDLCVWSLTTSEAFDIEQQSRRPGNMGVDPKMSGALEMQIACRSGEPDDPEAVPIFTSLDQVFNMPYEEFEMLAEVSMRVNGKHRKATEALQDFFDPTQGNSNSAKPAGVSTG